MCGIAGWIDFERPLSRPEHRTLMEKLCRTQFHRGPDEHGIFTTMHLLLGHQRLAVLDHEGGKQPLARTWQGHRYTLIYNGELYNIESLRQELLAKDYPLSTHSDTELLLWSYIDQPDTFLHKLEGMFSFALWDEHRAQLLLARDPLGIKPLFYAQVETGYLFASEAKALLQHPAVEACLDRTSLQELWAMYPARTPGLAPFSSMRELPPGHWMRIDASGCKITKYFHWKSAPHQDDFPTTLAWVTARLEKVVEQQLVADVPVGAMLSGGIDSSLLCALAGKHLTSPLSTYSVDYTQNEDYFTATASQADTDARWVELVVQHLGTKHRVITLAPEELSAALGDATDARDMPGMADVDTSLLLFARRLRQEVTVVLSGEGADEIFGGYPWFQSSLEQPCFPWMQQLPQRTKFLRSSWQERLPLAEYARERYYEACAEVPHLDSETAEEARLRRITYLTLTRWLPMLLERKDRMTMACGLETRVPFCDTVLAQYLWNLPWEMKQCDGQSKGLLRRICGTRLPEAIRQRPKNPYPRSHHPAYHRHAQLAVQSCLKDPSSPLHEFLDPIAVAPLLRSDAPTQWSWFGQIMQASSLLSHWLQIDAWWRKHNIRVKA